MLFTDDSALATHTALTTHTKEDLQQLMDRLFHAMGQDIGMLPSVNIDNVTFEVVDSFTYLGSTVTSNLSLDAEINTRIAHAATIMSKLNRRVWSNNSPTENTKLHVYHACVLGTLFYSSETRTTYARQEKKLNSFHLRCLRRILGISWQDRVMNTNVLEHAHSSRIDISWQDRITNSEVLEQAHSSSIDMLLSQRRRRWLGHVHWMADGRVHWIADGRIPKDLLYG